MTMRSTQKVIFVSALFLSLRLCLPFDAHAQSSDTLSANAVLPGCHNAVAGDYSFEAGICVGEVQTIILYADKFKICAPPGVNTGQAVRVISQWLDDRPQMHHLMFVLLAIQALKSTWPCQ